VGQTLKGIGVFLVIVVVVVAVVWAVTSFLDRHLGVTLSLPPMGYFDADDKVVCGELEPALYHMCATRRKMARLEQELRTLRGGCDPPKSGEVRIARLP
jgi:hypothetical protein